MTDASDTTRTAIDDTPNAERVDDPVDLDAIERDLDAVQTALDRLNDGTYWDDEVTGQPIPDDVLEADPTARSAPRGTGA